MDRNKLNNEIILCRHAVRKARVIVIRKTIKKIKILKSCKKDDIKEKKLKKATKLFRKVQIMKKVKDDVVTKFALLNEDYDFLLKTSKNLKKCALASLSKHDAVAKRIKNIREQIPNWKTELPLLLVSSKKRKVSQISKKKKVEMLASDISTFQTYAEYENNRESIEILTNKELMSDNREMKFKQGSKKNKSMAKSEAKSNTNKLDRTLPKISENSQLNNIKGHININELKNEIDKKIDDPFFIEKKVIAPKLISHDQVRTEKKNANSSIVQFSNQNNRSGFSNAEFDSKNKFRNVKKFELSSKNQNENLHPSWLAKKVKLIKPFEGKKIKFSDD